MEKIKLRKKKSIGFVVAKKRFAAAKRVAMAKVVAHRGEKEAG